MDNDENVKKEKETNENDFYDKKNFYGEEQLEKEKVNENIEENIEEDAEKEIKNFEKNFYEETLALESSKKTSLFQKILIRVMVVIIILFFLSLAGFLYWFFTIK